MGLSQIMPAKRETISGNLHKNRGNKQKYTEFQNAYSKRISAYMNKNVNIMENSA